MVPGYQRKILWSSVHHDCGWDVHCPSWLIYLKSRWGHRSIPCALKDLALTGKSSWCPLTILSLVLSHTNSAWLRDTHPFLPCIKKAYQSQDWLSNSWGDVIAHFGPYRWVDFHPELQIHRIWTNIFYCCLLRQKVRGVSQAILSFSIFCHSWKDFCHSWKDFRWK